MDKNYEFDQKAWILFAKKTYHREIYTFVKENPDETRMVDKSIWHTVSKLLHIKEQKIQEAEESYQKLRLSNTFKVLIRNHLENIDEELSSLFIEHLRKN